MVMEKYTDELNNIELFRYLYPGFPEGKLIRTESPDFILRNGYRNYLGIEITHVMDETHAERLSLDSEENRRKKSLLFHARDVFEFYSKTKINAALYFRRNRIPKVSNIIPSAGIIAKEILKKTQGKKRDEPFHMHFRIRDLSTFLESVTIFRFPGLAEPAWIDAGAFTLPAVNSELINRSIRLKEQKLQIYQKKRLEYYWLLLIADTSPASEVIMPSDPPYLKHDGSGFNKIFLIERRRGKLFELS